MRGGRTLAAVAVIALGGGAARADCPTAQAACLLDEEGVALLAGKQFDEAAAKFEASLTAGASARAALGFALALQGAGKLGLAYDAIVEADRLSAWELRGAPGDADVVARSQRIKYVLGDLRSRVGLVRVQLPVTIAPMQLVAVRREGRDVRDPRLPVAAAPGEALVAILRSGARFEVAAPAAAGGEASWIVPVEGAAVVPMPAPAGAAESAGVHAVIGADLALIPASEDDGNPAFGPLAHADLVLGRTLALTVRAGFLQHAAFTKLSEAGSAHVTGFEIGGWLGAAVTLRRPFYLAAELGVLSQSETATVIVVDTLPQTVSNDLAYVVYTLALGARWSHVDARIGLEGGVVGLGQSQSGSEGDLATRAMLTFGVDLYPW